jgi:hypothetical protein
MRYLILLLFCFPVYAEKNHIVVGYGMCDDHHTTSWCRDNLFNIRYTRELYNLPIGKLQLNVGHYSRNDGNTGPSVNETGGVEYGLIEWSVGW